MVNHMKTFQDANIDNQYYKLFLCTEKLIPFYRYFFTFYQMNKRVTVLELLEKTRVYDHMLFKKFIGQLESLISNHD